MSFSSSSPISLTCPQLYYHCTTQSYVIPPYLSMPWSWVITKYSIRREQHTPSTAYTKYTIYQVQHTLSIAPAQDCLSSLHCHTYKFTSECRLSCWCASLQIDRHQPALHECLKCKVTSLHSHCCNLTNCWRESPHLLHHQSTASRSSSSKTSCNLARSWAASVSSNSVDCGLSVHTYVRSILPSKCISTLSWLWPPILHAYILPVHP